MEQTSNKCRNGAYLIFLCAAAFFVVGRRTGFSLFGALYPYLGTIALPGLMVLLGQAAKPCLSSRRQAVCGGLGLITAGYVLKVMVYWAQTVLGRDPAFYPFSTSGVAWPFLVAGVCLLLAGALNTRRYGTVRLLTVTILIGLIGGMIRPFDSFLCLAQLCAFSPFFAAGCRMDMEQVERWCTGKRRAAAAAVILAGVLGDCLVLRRSLKVLWPMVDGDTWYGGCGMVDDELLLGWIVRLGWYAAAALLLFSLFCLTPKGRLPLVTRRGQWAVSGYFFFCVLGYLTMAPLTDGVTVKRLILAAGLMAVVLALFPSGWSDRLYRSLSECVWRAWEDREQPALRPEQKGFFRRHRWALETVGLFTLCFAVAAVGYVYPFLSNGKSLIWVTDGMGQQYPMMFYFKEYLLEGLSSFFQTGAFSFPQWDFSLGFGMTPLDALRREPFMLLALFGSEDTMEAIMDVTAVLRLYVCGLSFLWLCRTLGKTRKVPAVMGALVYVFCGFSLFASVRQPFFVTVLMTYEVLMLIGAERFIRERKYGLFVFSVFLQLFGGYYTAFLNGLVLALYLLVRLGCLYEGDLRRMAKTIGQLIGFYVWGACLAMMNLLPGVLSLFTSSREQGEQTIDLFYGNSYYRNVLTGLNLEFGGAGYWTYISLASIGWIGCILLFLRKKKQLRPYKIGLTVCMILIGVPAIGLLANGFAYISNRWCYCIPLLVALILVEMAPELLRLSRAEKGWMLAIVLSYAAIAVTRPEEIGEIKTIGLLILAMTALIVLLQDQFIPSRRLRMGILLAVTTLTVSISCAVSYLPEYGNYVSGFQDAGTAYDSLTQPTALAVEQIERREDEGSFYRVSRSNSSVNQSMVLGYYGTNAYYSVTPESVSRYARDIGLAAQIQAFRICGLDERIAPSALASVKYFIADGSQTAPYGFEQIWADEDGEVELYENQYALPLGYTYDSYVTQTEYESLSAVDKQQVMLESAVIDTEPEQLTHGDYTPEEQIPCEVIKLTDVTQEGSVFDAEEDGTIRLGFEGKANCESYLVLEGLRLADEDSNTSLSIQCTSAAKRQSISVRGKSDSYYFQRDAGVLNLGYSEESLTECTLTFGKGRAVTWDACYVVCVPMDGYADQIAALSADVLENVDEQGDVITGTIELTESKLLALSVPYTAGWSAWVNGEPAELLRVNTMYCGLLLEPGSYEIELRYEQPGSGVGTAISAVAAAAAVVTAVWAGKRRKKSREAAANS